MPHALAVGLGRTDYFHADRTQEKTLKLISFVTAWGIVGAISGSALADRDSSFDPNNIMVPGTDLRIQINQVTFTLEVEQHGISAPVPIPLSPGSADISTNVKRVRRVGEDVEFTVEQNCSKPLRLKLPVAHLRARIANVRGLKHHKAGRFDQAIQEFSAALGLDPTAAVIASNLACAQARAGQSEAAATTLEVLGRDNPAWVTWRLATDPDLSSLATHPRLTTFVTPRSKTITIADLGHARIALSPHHLVAHRRTVGSHGRGVIVDVVRLTDSRTGAVAVDLSVRNNEERAATERILSVLGFVTDGILVVTAPGEASQDFRARMKRELPGTGMQVIFASSGTRVMAGAHVVASEPLRDLQDDDLVPARWVGRVPGALVLSTYAPDRRGCIAETLDARVVPDK